ncbi:NAD-dependent epimerase/dehydratase family protein [Nonomuraea pusilla]|uniref:Nucleoside-diphosphate-sugar epimerase n=1 Tax=Nonomuraea pusilla TaxID=46177 RepID=A0A1H8AC85_9ACTN|nr:NAD(P)-dependent oxidoreductase [Nonomuraea pusilla]SEM68163.1 Nucleoside-diphosphate-sugar epimerase [Nonomuraea pusilla]
MTIGERTVLVTGADGNIGRATVAHLSAHGWRVVAFSLSFGSGVAGAARLVTGDVTVEHDVDEALRGGVDAVVHLAALPHWDSGTPYAVYTTNVVGTFTVLTHAAAAGVRRAVIASSIHASGIAGNHYGVLPPYFPLDEQTPIAHDDWYSLSKYSDERTAAMVASRWGMPVVALRFPLVNNQEVLRAVSAEWTEDPEAGLRLGWAYLDVRDGAEAIRLSLEAPATGASVLHLAARDTLVPFPTEELLDRYAPQVPRRRGFPGRAVPVSTDRAFAEIGFVPRYSMPMPELRSVED